MWNFFRKFQSKHSETPKVDSSPPEIKKARRSKPSEKDQATKRGEPYIKVIDFGIEQSDPRLGSFELDWNHIFVEHLRGLGYPGKTDEQVVELWFQDVCRNIVMETFEQEQPNFSENNYSARYINRRNIGGGKSEIS